MVWVTLTFAFAGLMYAYLKAQHGIEMAEEKTLEFITGYLIELTLSVDNMFVFVMLFTYFAIPAQLQRRALLWGVIGAIVMRAFMILVGVWLIAKFSWILFIFGAFLIITAIKMLFFAGHAPDLAKNGLVVFLKKHFRFTDQLEGEHFFVRRQGVLWATPLFLVLILIEVTDLVFAIDSIPAIFAITQDPFIVFSSNMFAMMGLRALYFLLADMNERFHLLKYGLGIVLLFIGTKLLILPWYHFPISLSLSFVVVVIAVSIVLSLMTTRKAPPSQKQS